MDKVFGLVLGFTGLFITCNYRELYHNRQYIRLKITIAHVFIVLSSLLVVVVPDTGERCFPVYVIIV